MSETPAKVVAELQKLSPDAIIELWVLDCAVFGGVQYPFHNQRTQGGAAVLFGGVSFQAIPITADGFALNGTEQNATPTLKIGDQTGAIRALLAQYDDLVGAKVTRIRTFRKYLDDGSEPDSTARLSDDVYFVNRKVSYVKREATFELDSSTNVDGAVVPARKILPRCQARFKDGVNCPYVGADSTCGMYVTDCAAKFGASTDLPFVGFPAIERVSMEA